MTRDRWDDSDDHEDSGSRDARRRRRRRRRRSGRPVSDEERAYREAQRRAKARIGFYAHLIAYAGVNMLVLAESRGRSLPMAIAWGIGLAFHYFSALVAPDLRRRMIDKEVQRQVTTGVSRERRALEGRHVRSLEDLSAQVAHEIRNPITAAKSLVQQMGCLLYTSDAADE